MVLVMTLVVTFVSVAINNELHAGFIIKWMKSWGLAFVIALPVVMFIMPIIKKTISKFIVE